MTPNSPTKKPMPFGLKPLTSFQKKIIIYVLINLILLIAFYVFISQMSSKIEIASDVISSYKAKQTNANVLMEYITKLEKDSKLVMDNFKKYEAKLVDLDDMPNVKKQIVDIGLKYKVDPLLNILTLNPAKEQEQISYGFVLSMNGSFDNIIKTFQAINNLNIFITFDQITIEKNIPKSTERILNDMTTVTTDTSSSTTKTTIRRTTTTKPTDVFKVSVIGKIYLKDNIKTDNHAQN
ncbi:MAG: type 4a pilus biogenesis protein PilO [Candidatus Pacebacteria bacterium]|nr:type 4a pilus biogenesis protein PilO [Candidatus Paceibacterota bacterium]